MHRHFYQNIVFALVVKFACLALVAVGAADMWAAIFADVGVMVLAVLNAIRALQVHNLSAQIRNFYPEHFAGGKTACEIFNARQTKNGCKTDWGGV